MNKADGLLAKIKQIFPELTWSDYAYLDEGWDHEVIILDESVVFRFPNDGDARDLKREIEILKQLRPLVAVRIPDYQYIAPDYSFAGYPLVPGQQLTKEAFDLLSAADRTVLAGQLADFLSVMHAVFPAPDVPFYMQDDQDEAKAIAEKHLPDVLSHDDYLITQEILSEVDVLLEQKLPAVFIHNDIYHSHLYWDAAAKQLGIIDFSDMTRADPAIDFGEIHEYGTDFVKEVYERYRGPKDATFLERAWAYQRWVGVYMMTDYFTNHKISFEESREIFDRTKLGPTP